MENSYQNSTISQIIDAIINQLSFEGESFEPFDKPYLSNIAEIIKSILDETEYNNAPNSRIAELLLELKEQMDTKNNNQEE